VITQLQFASLFEANYTVSSVMAGSAADFFGVPAPGDFNADNAVDGADLTRWRNGFGATGAPSHWDGNANGDDVVDGADLLIWQRQVGATGVVAASTTAPEPASALIAAFAIAAVACGKFTWRPSST
jgi:hypothetical protein